MFKRMIALALAGVLSLGLLSPAAAVQGSGCMPTTGTVSGLTFAQDVNAGIAALISSNSGASAPATDCSAVAIKGQVWLDTSTTPNLLKQYDGANWVVIGGLDSTNHLWAPPIGGGVTSVASATTVDLGASPTAAITITGTTTITSFGSSAVTGTIRALTFTASLTLTYGGSAIILPGGINVQTASGDTALVQYAGGGNWRVLAYQPLGLSPQAAAYTVRGNATGSQATPTDISIPALTLKASPASADKVMIADSAASNALKYATLLSISQMAGGTVQSVTCNAGLTGGTFTVAGTCGVDFASKADQQAATSTVKTVSPAHQQDHPGSPKVWAIFAGSTGVGSFAPTAAYNVSSVSKISAGFYQLIFSTAFSSSSYACIVTAETPAGGGVIAHIPPSARQTTSIQIETLNVSPTNADATFVHVACFGAQ